MADQNITQGNSASPQDPSALLNSLLQNPEALQGIVSSLSQTLGTQGSSAPQSQAPQLSPAMPDLSAMLSDPATLAKLSSVMSALGSAQKSGQTAHVTQQANQTPSAPSQNKSAALLAAMKPYLSHERQEAIERIIRLSQLGELFKNF